MYRFLEDNKGGEIMGVGYCIKCKGKTMIVDGKLEYYKNGTPVEKGTCKECGSRMNRMYNKEERQALKDKQLEGEKI